MNLKKIIDYCDTGQHAKRMLTKTFLYSVTWASWIKISLFQINMNIFRLFGDLSHLLAIVLLLMKIWKTRSCAGISGKSQILFLVVFVTRYLDLITSFISLYNTVMKLFFIGSAAGTVYLMYQKFKVCRQEFLREGFVFSRVVSIWKLTLPSYCIKLWDTFFLG